MSNRHSSCSLYSFRRNKKRHQKSCKACRLEHPYGLNGSNQLIFKPTSAAEQQVCDGRGCDFATLITLRLFSAGAQWRRETDEKPRRRSVPRSIYRLERQGAVRRCRATLFGTDLLTFFLLYLHNNCIVCLNSFSIATVDVCGVSCLVIGFIVCVRFQKTSNDTRDEAASDEEDEIAVVVGANDAGPNDCAGE